MLPMFLLMSACRPAGPDLDPDAPIQSDTSDADWSAVDAYLDEAFASQDAVDGFGLWVWRTEGDELVYHRAYGGLTAEDRLAVASASKLVTGLVFLRMVELGQMSLSSTTAEVLGWQGTPEGAITLDHAGAFVTGFDASNPCTFRPGLTLSECVDDFREAGLQAPPGTQFDYGAAHMHVGSVMVEAVTGVAYNDAFAMHLAQPLGLNDDGLRFYTLPAQGIGTTNPLTSGGLQATVAEYSQFLRVVAHAGTVDGVRVVSPELVARMFRNDYTTASVAFSPYTDAGYDFRYGYGGWLECDGAVAECDVFSSAGAFGFTPWVDREHGYYAILAMQGPAGTGATLAVTIEQDVQPMVLDVLQ
mgnify:CR=1 FL=1